MKRFGLFLTAIVVFLLSTSCKEEIEISLSKSSLQFAYDGGSQTIEVLSNGDWSVTSVPDWVELSARSGSGNATLTVTVQRNMTSEAKSGVVEVQTKDNTASFIVEQDFLEDDILVVDPSLIEIGVAGGDVEVSISSSSAWYFGEIPLWIHASATSGDGDAVVILTIESGESQEQLYRNAIIPVISGDLSVDLNVTQFCSHEDFLTITPSTQEMPCEGGAFSISVVSSLPWTVTPAEWTIFSVTEGEGAAEIEVTVTENTAIVGRTAEITFMAGQLQSVLSLSQEAAPDPHYLEVSPMQLDFASEGGTQSIEVSCDIEWTVQPSAAWITVSMTEGVGDGAFDVIVEPNEYAGVRTASILVLSGTKQARIRVSQESGSIEPYFEVNPTTVVFEYEGGTNIITVSSNIDWRLKPLSWVEASLTEGHGNAEIELTVGQNPGQTSLTEEMIFEANGNSFPVTVYQRGPGAGMPILEVDVTEINAPREGGAFTVNITGNQQWSVSSAAWVIVTPESGENNGVLTVKVLENPIAIPRTSEIKVSSAALTRTIQISQSGTK